MQMCGECMKVYDESEYTKCPFVTKRKMNIRMLLSMTRKQV